MSDAEPAGDETSIVTKISPRSVTDTVARLTELVGNRGMRLFAVIDQSAEARQAGLQLKSRRHRCTRRHAR
jgi:uncharacterized protein (DUF302 family)